MNVGQTCVAPDYLLVHKEIKDQLLSKLVEKIKIFYGNNPKTSKDYGRIVNEKQLSRIKGLINEDKVILGGDYDVEELYMAPTIMNNVTWEDKVMEEEIFGPVLPILEFEDLNEIINKINSKPKPLALYLFTESREVEKKVVENISYGGGYINDTFS